MTNMLIEETSGWIAAVSSAVVFAAPAAQFMNVLKGRLDYEDTSTVLIGTIYCNCLTWYVYGDLIYSDQMKICNLLGCCFSLLFITIYLAYEIKKNFVDAVLNALIIFTGSWAAYRFLTSILADPVDVGKVCAATSLIALIYPFNLLLRVIKEKNYRLISFVVAGFTLPSGVCWFIYGIMLHDYYIMCPNLLAFFIAVAQIIVKKKYKAKYPILELVPETSTVGIESTSDGANTKNQDSVEVKADEDSGEEGTKIKAQPVKIVAKNESK